MSLNNQDNPFAYDAGRAEGFGAFGDGVWTSAGDDDSVGTGPPVYVQDGEIFGTDPGASNTSNNGPTWWQLLISGGTRIAHDALTPIPVGVAQAHAAQQQVVYQPTALQNRGTTPGVGIGVDGSGIRLSDGSHIGWFPIIGLIGVIFLLQSPGFQRRSR